MLQNCAGMKEAIPPCPEAYSIKLVAIRYHTFALPTTFRNIFKYA